MTEQRRRTNLPRTLGAVAIFVTLITTIAPSGHAPVADAAAGTQASRYVAISPLRILDTRDPGFKILRDGDTISINPLTAPVLAAAGVDPLDVEAVAINLTMTRTVATAWLRTLPTALTTPNDVATAAVNNRAANVDVANLSIVPVGANGLISIYALRSSHVIVDVQGVFTRATSSKGGRFVPLALPTRAIDTRNTQPPLAAQSSLVVDLTPFEVPASASAAVINIVATRTTGPGYLTAYPGGLVPNASNLNFTRPGEDVAAGAIARLDNGKVHIFTSTTTHVIVDVIGYMTGESAEKSSSGLFVSVEPERHYDSRPNEHPVGTVPLAAGTSRAVQIAGPQRSIPSTGVLGIAANLTMTNTGGPGYLVMYPREPVPPEYSSVNSVFANQTVGNHAIATLDNGSVRIHAAVQSDFIVDVTGYFLDGTTTPPTSPRRTATNPAPMPEVNPGPVPQPGSPEGPPFDNDYEFLFRAIGPTSSFTDPRTGVRYFSWNPCQPITYAVNTQRATQDQIKAMNRAISHAETASGIDFQYVGQATGSLDPDDLDPTVSGGGTAMAVIGFSDPYATPGIDGLKIGLGGITNTIHGSSIQTSGNQGWIVRGGYALVDISDIITPDEIESAFTHELGHMLGLNHVAFTSATVGELMRPVISNPPQTFYGDGDKNGLYKIGEPQCPGGAPLRAEAPSAPMQQIDYAISLD